MISMKMHDPGRVALVSSVFFLVFVAHYLFKSAVVALVVTEFGARGVPWTDLLEASLSLAIVIVLLTSSWLRSRYSTIIALLACISIGILIAFPTISEFRPIKGSALVCLYLAGSVLVLVGVYCGWMLLTSIVRGVGWLEFAIVGACAQIGVIVATLIADSLNVNFGSMAIVLSSAAVYFAAFFLIVVALRVFSCSGTEEAKFLSVQQVPEGISLQSISAFLKTPYFRALSLLMICQSCFGGGIQWNLYTLAETTESASAATELLSSFYRVTGIACLVAQLVFVPAAFFWITLRRGLFILPVVSCVAFVVIAFPLSAQAIFILVATYKTLDYTVNNCMKEAIMIPTPLRAKVQLKAVLSLFVSRLAAGISASLVLVFSHVGHTGWVLAMGLVLLGWWLSAARCLRIYDRLQRLDTKVVVPSVDDIATS